MLAYLWSFSWKTFFWVLACSQPWHGRKPHPSFLVNPTNELLILLNCSGRIKLFVLSGMWKEDKNFAALVKSRKMTTTNINGRFPDGINIWDEKKAVCPGVHALAIHKHLAQILYPTAGSMFSCLHFSSKDLRNAKLESHVDCSAK